jgi:hypothetical protein
MSDKPPPPTQSPPSANSNESPRKTRRKFLKAVTLGLPVAAAAGLGRAVAGTHEANSKFPDDPAAWRQRFLADARATKTS